MELKKTLCMPRTDFEMRGNLPTKEPKILESWEAMHLYEKMVEKNKGKDAYMLHDGPPYANGNMHCGHMLNHLLKDFIVRYQNMKGKYTVFIPGWDTHGLPIENMVTKKGINRKTTPIATFRQYCEEYAHQQVALQMGQVKRLGVQGDFEHRYMTLQHDFEMHQLEVFKAMALKGFIFKGLKPVYWSPSSESALAEAEIEYHDIVSDAIYVAFPVRDGKGVVPNDASFVIWTTTPWTMPANLAICLNPYYEYGVFQTEKGKYIFLKKFAEDLKEKWEFSQMECVQTFLGKEAEYVACRHPLYDRDSLVIVGEHVTDDAGTGCVHTAPGHGEDDYNVGKNYHLDILCPVDEHGRMTAEAGSDLEGMFYEDANAVVLEKLKAVGALLRSDKIQHSYPHDWRTKKPVIFRATPQWFCSIEPIKQQLLDAVHSVHWTPSWGEVRMNNMIESRGDWCISRQRAWGVPIPIFYCEDGTPIMEEKVFDHIIALVEEHGSNIWFIKEAKELLPEGYTNPHSPNGIFKKEKDIMDVWFDSGSSSLAVLKGRGLKFPADLYLEGSDQYRGWFNSSLIISVALTGKAPYENVISHGFILDPKGEKMSKSLGNGVDPLKLISVYGADVLRLWAAGIDYTSDVRIGDSLIRQVSETYRKIRNTFKFLLGNLSDGVDGPWNENEKVDHFERVDELVLACLESTKNEVIDAMDQADFARALSSITSFLSGTLSSFYLDMTKDILYCEKKDSYRRRAVQTVLDRCVDVVSRLLTPILPFTMEEVYRHYPTSNKKESIQLTDYPMVSHEYGEKEKKDFAILMNVRADVLKALEEARSEGLIGSAQEAEIVLESEEYEEFLKQFSVEELCKIFIVSRVTVSKEKQEKSYAHTTITLRKHSGVRCDRCWNYVEKVSEFGEIKLCSRCALAVKDTWDKN